MELKLYPDRVLRRKCRPILEVNEVVAARAQEMLDFMYQSEGIGLAGPQVGWSQRICTLDVDGTRNGRRIFINPIVVQREGYAELEEGCLSLPGVQLHVPRAAKVAIVAYMLNGERVELEAEGIAACAWQHEMDHLNGVLIIDRVPPTTLVTIREQLKKLEESPPRE